MGGEGAVTHRGLMREERVVMAAFHYSRTPTVCRAPEKAGVWCSGGCACHLFVSTRAIDRGMPLKKEKKNSFHRHGNQCRRPPPPN